MFWRLGGLIEYRYNVYYVKSLRRQRLTLATGASFPMTVPPSPERLMPHAVPFRLSWTT
jgi:hypothetical protein